MVQASLGGSMVTSWTPRESSEQEFPYGKEMPIPEGKIKRHPGALYHLLVRPLTQMSVRGVIWEKSNIGRSERCGKNRHALNMAGPGIDMAGECPEHQETKQSLARWFPKYAAADIKQADGKRKGRKQAGIPCGLVAVPLSLSLSSSTPTAVSGPLAKSKFLAVESWL